MKQLLDSPSWQSGPVRLADFAELLALRADDNNVASQNLIEALKRNNEEEDEKYETVVDAAFSELGERKRHLGPEHSRYPYEIKDDLLVFAKPRVRQDADLLYLFLLLTTRLNMKEEKKQASLDGTALFEFLSLEVAKRYWGGPEDARVKGVVFGTAGASWRVEEDDTDVDKGQFELAVNGLCKDLNEGGCFRPKDHPIKIVAKDDKLDIVVWREFSDMRAGKLIGFGQCKTGTNWERELPRLNPFNFCNRWLDHHPLAPPVKLFFLTDRVADLWKTRGYEAGILFDRCRILDYAEDLPKALLADCACWTMAALNANGLGW